tara:strand:- start:1873 stop:2811 length:939 start_codon:yes stop_codon:yes gene_type:complete
MKYSKLGNSELEVSNICLGTWPIGGGMGAIEQKDAINAIHASIDNGINFLDTAQMYLDSEYILGKAIKGKRNKIIIASKLSSWKNINDIEKALENSLKNLQTDVIDLYQIHSWQESIPMEDTFSKLLELKEKGYFKYLGVSNFSAKQIEKMNKFSGNQIISSQPHFSILFRHSEKEIIPQSHSLGIGSIVYSPIARGLLSGKYKPGHIFNEDDARHNHHTFEDEHLEKGLRIYNILLEWIKDKGFNPTQLAIAWTLYTDGVTSAICGSKNPEQAISNAKAGEIDLTQDDISEINKLTENISIYELITPKRFS